MAHKIVEIEGIGPVYAEKLTKAGIETAEQLLEKCCNPKGRKELVEATGISNDKILTWTNHADLFRIKGVGPQFSELLEAAGVDTVKEFRHRVAENLVQKLQETNDAKRLVRRVPSVKQVAKMIEAAKELKPVMTY